MISDSVDNFVCTTIFVWAKFWSNSLSYSILLRIYYMNPWYLYRWRHTRESRHNTMIEDQIEMIRLQFVKVSVRQRCVNDNFCIWYFIFVYLIFMSEIVFFLHSTSVPSFHIDVVLTLFMKCLYVNILQSVIIAVAYVASNRGTKL